MAVIRDSRATIKHGLYSKRLSKDEAKALGLFALDNIEGEIDLQRAVINRLAEILEHNGLGPGSREPLNDISRDTVKILNQSLRDLLRYVRVHAVQNSDEQLYLTQVEAGKRLARKRRNVFDYLKTP